MDRLLHNVANLPFAERSAVEAIIGHALRDDQRLYIVALDTPIAPATAVRQQAWNEIDEIIAEAHENVRHAGVTPEELERTIDEACNEVRYGK